MTNIMEYRAQLCKEFIKNEEDYLSRSENLASLKKARKEKERKEELHKRNVEFLLSLAVAFVMIATNGISKDILRAHPEIIDKVGRFNYDDLLVEINGLDNPNRIYPGQEILYPVF